MKEDWVQHGNYDIQYEYKNPALIVEDKWGKEMKIPMPRHLIHLRHTKSGDVTTIKRYKHQKRWLWGDSREEGSCSLDHVIEELGRMLFSGDEEDAEDFLRQVIPGHV
jgi:hypothetical protein